ncbi:DUF503 domain-containing protein [Bacillaceae bacterium SIJ1]|uniref:DUF503 domain-containing protein n=1 Tax=Litoribacterium kuwaitense TaxID=1398745 RepID=UPI0013EDBF05|nr:DUF503 domain-containing protein [Litoribacterium kuwaitense]NGP44088.1 DUF503 domain-containing protein [Litoribacterium kuwaitense]
MIAVLVLDCHLYDCHSLKQKRAVIRPILSRLGQVVHMAATETGHHDLWQRAELTIVAVGHERRPLERDLDTALSWLDDQATLDARIVLRGFQ